MYFSLPLISIIQFDISIEESLFNTGEETETSKLG